MSHCNCRRFPVGRALALACAIVGPAFAGGGPYFADGIKIGEVDADSAIVWVRLTAAPERNLKGIPFGKNDSAPPGVGGDR